MASLRQIRANQLNAMQSSGAKTDEGKAASRRNALKHGLAGSGLVLPEDEAEAVNARWARWQLAMKPDDAYSDWMVGRIASLSIRLERVEAHERALREIRAARASRDWDLERRIAAEELGEKLPKAPARVALELRRNPAGCEWLRTRWEALAATLDAGGTWDQAQRSLALSLLGTPREDRADQTLIDADAPALRALVEAEIAALDAIDPAALAEADEFDRTAAELGFGPVDRELALVRRYARSLTRQIDEFRKQIKSAGSTSIPAGDAPNRAAPVEPPRFGDPDPQARAPAARPSTPAPAFEPAPEAPDSFDLNVFASRPPTTGPSPEIPLGNRRNRRAVASRTRRRG